MFNHKKLAKKQKQFLSITGVTPQQFDSLSKKIQKQYKITEAKRLSEKERKRDIGAGHKFDHCLKDRILMLLMYYRMYTTYDLWSGPNKVRTLFACFFVVLLIPLFVSHLPLFFKFD